MTDYKKLVEELREYRSKPLMHGQMLVSFKQFGLLDDAAAAIEALQADVKRLQEKLCDWCAVCPKERRKPEDCELLSETPVMYGPSEAKMEVQE